MVVPYKRKNMTTKQDYQQFIAIYDHLMAKAQLLVSRMRDEGKLHFGKNARFHSLDLDCSDEENICIAYFDDGYDLLEIERMYVRPEILLNESTWNAILN